ncbi:HNH endonuclease [Azospirillum brasilense]|uniref:HNH endonuclease n=1 Tax=Azospirillum brasilense TaxID=192 RepID=UPI001909FD2C|nr:HNH endonuclease [Azospirillum brasilense]
MMDRVADRGMTVVALGEVVNAADQLMGVKAVWGRSSEAVMCFGSRGNAALKDRGHFSQARTTAERALNQPYFLTIGGGEQVPDALQGRVLELVRATGIYGETTAFVRDEELRARLAQWPVAIIVSEVYSVRGEPHLVEDLGFPNRRILANAYDTVIRDDEEIQRLWNALQDWEVERRWDVMPPQGFYDHGRVQQCGSMYPTLSTASPEGRRIWTISREIERDPRLKREVKALNRAKNGGILVCEACKLSDDLASMFDAHHLQPLAAGKRDSRVDDLVVLCPSCHRCAHMKADDKLSPLSVEEVAALMMR